MIEMCPTEKQKRLIKKRIQYFGEEKVLFYEKHFSRNCRTLKISPENRPRKSLRVCGFRV